MAIASSRLADGGLATLFGVGAVGSLPDVELLSLFASPPDRATAELAFATIVERHGPMVLGVCRRMLRNSHAADDAFQATFLILARKSSAVHVDGSLGPWLYGVAIRVARRTRAIAKAEGDRLQAIDRLDPPDAQAEPRPAQVDELRAAIDGEIFRLPHRYRSVAVLCYLEGLSQEQAARRLRCPIGTVQSRLHRARERLRAGLRRRGWEPTAWSPTLLMRAEIPRALAATTVASSSAGTVPGVAVDLVSAAVSEVVRQSLRSMFMAKGLRITLLFIFIALPLAGAISLAAGRGESNPAGEAAPAPAQPPAVAPDTATQPAPADLYAKIKAEYEDKESAMQDAMSKAVRQRERNQAYEKTAPDEAAFSRRMIDLAESTPGSKPARDALLWVLNKPNLWDDGPYGDQFARASALLLRHYGDDPEAIRIGLQLDNIPSPHRDALLLGFFASAKGRESQGLARLGLAQYLDLKARLVRNDRLTTGRQKIILQGVIDDDGKAIDMPVEPSDKRYAYTLQQRLYDPDAIAAEAERLLREVIEKYADIPFVTVWHRDFEAILRMPKPTWKNRPLHDEMRKHFEKYLQDSKTLGQVAQARLDEIRNRAVGKPAAEIDGVDLDGKAFRLSDYKGKVVALVFWKSWCESSLREIPRERELAERLKGRPFALLGVACNENKPAVLKAMKDERITWPNWFDGAPHRGVIASRYHVKETPATFVIDGRGIVRYEGLLGAAMEAAIGKLLEEHEAQRPPG